MEENFGFLNETLMFEEYSLVRIIKLNEANRPFDGTKGVMKPPKIGDIGTIVHIVERTNPTDTIYIVEKVSPTGATIWLADFRQDELVPEDEPSEDDYLIYLDFERHMYAWCLENIGGLPATEASQKALEVYPYESPSQKYRWLPFHDEAWHWAMRYILGEMYWISNPGLQEPSPAYLAELNLYEAKK